MTLHLDKRQRAMLREMGVQVWSPLPEAPAASAPEAPAPAPAAAMAPAVGAAQAPAQAPAPSAAPRAQPPSGVFFQSAAPSRPAPAAAAKTTAAATPAVRGRETEEPTATGWRVGERVSLAGEGDASAERGPRWLLLAEGRPEDLSEGAGQLLRNMLKAAQLHTGAQVWLAPLERSAGGQVEGLDEVLGQSEPDVVFIMSRLGAQALLETQEPLGRLRGQVHDLWGLPAVVSYDLGALLRNPSDKGKAWDDLCLALQVARAQHAERLDAE